MIVSNPHDAPDNLRLTEPTSMLKAAEIIGRKYRLTVIGLFSEDWFKERCDQLLSAENINYLGWQDPEVVARILDRMDIGLIPFELNKSYKESRPTKMLEYMRSGLAVVSTEVTWVKDLVEQYKCGGIAKDPSALSIAETVKLIVEGGQLYKMKKNASLSSVAFTWDSQYEIMEKAYIKLLARS